MGCASCGTSVDGKPSGCKSNGGCSSGGCNKLNTFDWLAKMDISDSESFDVVEISFKNGSRKAFYENPPHVRAIIGDMVVVESASGYDVGRVSLTGELVRLQMKKKKVSDSTIFPKLIRRANDRDLEKLAEARSLERDTRIRARVIARSLNLDMKLGDVEYQGDRRKATFYYTADGRVDFRELIRHYAKEFRVKIEMRQIGARQESSRIGGLGSCGRELCCSTWLTNFKSVTTGAARYQNLAINQSKLSGQCGRLKCCLNYELDTYMDALQDFPVKHERLYTEAGTAVLIKTDIFKRQMIYAYENPAKRGNFYTLDVDRVKFIQQENKNGEKPMELVDSSILLQDDEVTIDFEDVTGAVELPPEKRNRRKPRGGGRKGRNDRKDLRSNRRNDARRDGNRAASDRERSDNRSRKTEDRGRSRNPKDRNAPRDGERGKSRGQDRNAPRDGERGKPRGQDRNAPRDGERGKPRGQDRNAPRDGERGKPRGQDRNAPRNGEKGKPRGQDRNAPRDGEKGKPRGQDRNAPRNGERGKPRGQDRNAPRDGDRSKDRNRGKNRGNRPPKGRGRDANPDRKDDGGPKE